MPGGLGPGDLGLRPGEPMPGRAGKYPGRSLTDFGASQSDGKESGRGKRDAEARRELAPSSLPPLRSQAPLDAAPLGDRMASSIPPAPASSEPTQALPDGSARFLIRRYAHVRPKPQRGEQPDYTESVLWEPLVRTDDQGRAKFRFELPETATRFHLQTDAHGPGRVGAAVQSVQAVRADD
jgi:hypothetical protein